MEIVINLLIFLLSGFWFQQGIVVYKFWENDQPGSGFLPVLFALLLMILSLFLIVRELSKRKKTGTHATATEEKANSSVPAWVMPLLPAGYSLLTIGAMVALGLVPSMFLSAYIWLKQISKVSLLKSLAISGILTVIVYGIFVMWLRIPFPRGIFGI
ncbi:MAG: tripartite tricarboxylate transporter TctB family protein [Sphaerochaetaceae bacterium]